MPCSCRISTPAVIAVLFVVAASPLSAGGQRPASAEVIQIAAQPLAESAVMPIVDGKMTDEAWLKVEPYTNFIQTDPIEGAPASERTEVRVLYDKSTLYIGVIAFDSEPGKIVVTQSRRDADITESDAIIVVLDTFNDNQNAFVFGTNPLGIEYDGQVAGEGQTSAISQNQSGTGGSQRGGVSSFNANWDGDWVVKSAITDRGWETEIAIPFKTLRYPTGTNKTWGFNVKRNIRRKNEQVFLSPVTRGFDIFRVSSAAKLTGLNLPPRRDIKLIPYVLGSANKDYTFATDQLDNNGARRPRREVGRASEPHRRLHGQHRLRAGRGRRGAGQPDAVRSVLPGEAPLLPRERVGVPVRRRAVGRAVLLAADRAVRHRRIGRAD